MQGSQTFPGPPSIETLTRQADVVVVGDVTATHGEWDAAGTNILTRVHLRRVESLKGSPPTPLSFTHLGGRVGDLVSGVAGAVRFTAGERVLVFLAGRPPGALRLGNLLHGKFLIERDAATGQEAAVRFTGAQGAERVSLDHVRAAVRRTLGG